MPGKLPPGSRQRQGQLSQALANAEADIHRLEQERAAHARSMLDRDQELEDQRKATAYQRKQYKRAAQAAKAAREKQEAVEATMRALQKQLLSPGKSVALKSVGSAFDLNADGHVVASLVEGGDSDNQEGGGVASAGDSGDSASLVLMSTDEMETMRKRVAEVTKRAKELKEKNETQTKQLAEAMQVKKAFVATLEEQKAEMDQALLMVSEVEAEKAEAVRDVTDALDKQGEIQQETVDELRRALALSEQNMARVNHVTAQSEHGTAKRIAKLQGEVEALDARLHDEQRNHRETGRKVSELRTTLELREQIERQQTAIGAVGDGADEE